MTWTEITSPFYLYHYPHSLLGKIIRLGCTFISLLFYSTFHIYFFIYYFSVPLLFPLTKADGYTVPGDEECTYILQRLEFEPWIQSFGQIRVKTVPVIRDPAAKT